MDKSIDLFLATFLLLIIFFLTMLATNFILSNLFKKLDEVYALTTVKSVATSWGFNPGYPPDVSLTDSKDPVWQYGGFAYAEYRPVVNYDLGVMYSPPVRVYYGVVDPLKMYHLQVFAMENNYITLKRFLGMPQGNEFNLYVEMPAPLELTQTNNFWNVMEYFEKNYRDNKQSIKPLRIMDSPYKYMRGDVIATGVKCGEGLCIPQTDDVKVLHSINFDDGGEGQALKTENLHYYGVSYGVLPYKGTSLEYIVNIYQDFLSMNYAIHKPRVTLYTTGDVGYRVEVGSEVAYPVYSKYLNVINPDNVKEFPQFTLFRLDMILENLAYKPSTYSDNDSHLLIRFIYLPVAFLVRDTSKLDYEKNKPFDMMVQVMFIPDVEKPSQVIVKEVSVIIEQEDLGVVIKKTLQPKDQSNFFYVFTFHWEPHLEEMGYSMNDVFKVSKNYGNKVPLNVRVYVKYEYLGETHVKAYSFNIKVWEIQDDGFYIDVVNTAYRVFNNLFHIKDALELQSKVDKLYDLYYKDVGLIS